MTKNKTAKTKSAPQSRRSARPQVSGERSSTVVRRASATGRERGNPARGQADFETQAAAAKYVGKDVRTIQRWKARGMPVIDLGGGKVGYTKAMLDKFKKMSEGDEQNVLLKTEEIGLKGIKRQLAAMDLAVRRGELIPADEVARRDVAKITAAKRVLLAMPRKLAPLIKGKSTVRIQQILKDEVYRCLNVLAGEKIRRQRTDGR